MVYEKLKKIAKRFLGRNDVSNSILWSGDFDTWENAEKECSGYDGENIINKVSEALIKVKNGEAEYERDAHLFYTLEYNWSLVALIQKAYLETNKELLIVDFGGSLGSSYFQNRKMLANVPYKWIVIEQPHYTEKGKALFEDECLHFVNDFQEIQDKIDIILFSSVLQYVNKPTFYILQAIKKEPSFIYIERTGFIEAEKELITVQKIPAYIYEATYASCFFVERDFLSNFQSQFEVIADLDSTIDTDIHSEKGVRLYWKGFILKKLVINKNCNSNEAS